jgi:hypothetical protein
MPASAAGLDRSGEDWPMLLDKFIETVLAPVSRVDVEDREAGPSHETYVGVGPLCPPRANLRCVSGGIMVTSACHRRLVARFQRKDSQTIACVAKCGGQDAPGGIRCIVSRVGSGGCLFSVVHVPYEPFGSCNRVRGRVWRRHRLRQRVLVCVRLSPATGSVSVPASATSG